MKWHSFGRTYGLLAALQVAVWAPGCSVVKQATGGYTPAERAERSRTRDDRRQRKRPGYEAQPWVAEGSSGADPTEPAERSPAERPSRTESTDEAVGEPEASRPGRAASAQARTVIHAAERYLGVRYQWGGMSRNGVDCSGLMVLAFREAGIDLPRVSGDQYAFGKPIKRQAVRPGDLLFFRSGSKPVIGHSGLVTEVADGDITFIHAISNGVTKSKLSEPHWAAHYLKACRVLN